MRVWTPVFIAFAAAVSGLPAFAAVEPGAGGTDGAGASGAGLHASGPAPPSGSDAAFELQREWDRV